MKLLERRLQDAPLIIWNAPSIIIPANPEDPGNRRDKNIILVIIMWKFSTPPPLRDTFFSTLVMTNNYLLCLLWTACVIYVRRLRIEEQTIVQVRCEDRLPSLSEQSVHHVPSVMQSTFGTEEQTNINEWQFIFYYSLC